MLASGAAADLMAAALLAFPGIGRIARALGPLSVSAVSPPVDLWC